MTGWTAIVPIKPLGDRKTRLAGYLTARDRAYLSETLFAGVIGTLQASPEVARILVVAKRPPDVCGPEDNVVEWVVDRGKGLNAALEDARLVAGDGRQLILHADLPLVAPADIAALLAAAGDDIAIAPDRRRIGTNALAIGAGRRIVLRFGDNSFASHRDQYPNAAILSGRPGLEIDIDAPADYVEALRLGWLPD